MTNNQVKYLFMDRINIYEAKRHLSRYLARVRAGETLILCNRNVPVAELRPVAQARKDPRPLGLCAGQFTVPDAFFNPLPDELLDLFEDDAG